MAIPDYESLMLPLLRLAGSTPTLEISTPDAARTLAVQLHLTEEERTALLPSGGTFVFASRVSWACTYLKKAGLLAAPRRGFFQITKRGLEILKSNPTAIDNEFLNQFSEFRDFRTRSKAEQSRAPESTIQVATPGVPEEVIAAQYELQRKALATQLLDAVKSGSAEFFERLVVQLLVRIGYGGTLADAGSAVGRTGDGGIDGVIKEDKLGLDAIYIQAKRWDDKPVGSPQVDQFAGALQKKKAHKGVLITESTFTAEARRSVADYPVKIVLIDGAALAQLMIDHGVGVSTVVAYELKRIDSDFFEEGYSTT